MACELYHNKVVIVWGKKKDKKKKAFQKDNKNIKGRKDQRLRITAADLVSE